MKSILFSLRYLSKARGSNVTRVISLTLGLAVSLLIFSYVSFLLSFDRCFPDSERIYQVWAKSRISGIGISSRMFAPLAPALKETVPQIECATRTIGVYQYDFTVGEDTYPCSFWAVDTSFFEVFGMKLLSGSSPREVFGAGSQLMISKSLAQRAFKGEDPIGKEMLLNNQMPFTVGGVFEELPVNTSFGSFDVLLPLDFVTKVNQMYTGWNGGDSFETYIKLQEGSRIVDVEAQIPELIEKYGITRVVEEWGLKYIFYPISRSSFVSGNNASMVKLLSALAFLLLFVATMNYVLISISGLVKRSRTIALLKCNGAHRKNIFSIFLWETAFLILISLVIAVLVLIAASAPIEHLTSYPMSELFAWKRIWAPASVLLLCFLLAGVIPARLFTKVPIEAAFTGMTDSRKKWKQVLLGVEIACISCVVVVLWALSLQFKLLNDGDFGYNHKNLVATRLYGRPSQYEAYVQEISSLPEVESVGHTMSIPLYGYSGQPCVDNETREMLFSCRIDYIDRYYIPAMQMEMAEGVNFNEESNTTDVIVNEEYVRKRGWTGSALGREIIDRPSPKASHYTIIGVVKDFRMNGLSAKTDPLVIHYLPEWVNDESTEYGGLVTVIRLHNVDSQSLDAVTQQIKGYRSADNYNISIFSEMLTDQLSPIRSLRNIMLLASLITLLIALIGLLGYLSDEVNRRSREIAVRKVNGATVRDVLTLLVRSTMVMILVSIAVGTAASYFVVDKMLEYCAQRIPMSWWLFAGSAAAVFAAVYIIQIIKTWHIANSNPSLMLKTE